MKYRESGMPDEQLWDTFFSPEEILLKLDVDKNIHVLLDIGCGYGTFLLPASGIVKNRVLGIDIEDKMIEICRKKISLQQINNIEVLQGDITTAETIQELGKYSGEIDYICLFNILHCEQPLDLLCAARSLLKEGGKIGVIHWKQEDTPRGPSMAIRPTPDTIKEWASKSGFSPEKEIDLPPYHFGLVFQKRGI